MKKNVILLNALLAGIMISVYGCGSENLDLKSETSVSVTTASDSSVITTAADETPAETENTNDTTTEISESTNDTATDVSESAKEKITEPAGSETVAANTTELSSVQTASVSAAESEIFTAAGGDVYLGTWESDRLTMIIEEDPDTRGNYIVTVSGAGSADVYYTYKYFCSFDYDKNIFTSEFGTLTTDTGSNSDTEAGAGTIDGERAEFYADYTSVTWKNLTEDNSEKIVFTRRNY